MGKMMIRLKNDPTIEAMIKNEMKSTTFNLAGKANLIDKSLAKNLEEMYDRIVPLISDYIKNMRLES